jgi:hypothetical protein
MVEHASRQQPNITLLTATVHEEQHYHDSRAGRDDFVVRTPPGALQLGLCIVLSAELDDGRGITAENSFGIVGATSRDDVLTQIDRMLGRKPHDHRPRVLAWRPLIVALANAGISVSESELTARPLRVSYEPAAQRALAAGPET